MVTSSRAERQAARAARVAVTAGILLLQVLQAAAKSNPGLCFEKVSSQGYLSLVGHPASRRYAVANTQAGLVDLVGIPDPGTNNQMLKKFTFLDLTSRVLFDRAERGLLSVAFHPKYNDNGRFFVSYICDGIKFPECQGPCTCRNSSNCVPSNDTTSRGPGCWSNTVLAEYRVENPRSWFSRAVADSEKILFKFARAFTFHNAGAIFFGKDGYLYYSSGDSSEQGDPYNFAQMPQGFQGKILRFDVDNIPAGKRYGIPIDNPFRNSTYIYKEIFATGLRNPWRCSADLETNAIFCGDVGYNTIEEVNQIVAGGNYGWPRYEGTRQLRSNVTLKPPNAPLKAPLFQYAHSSGVPGVPQGGYCVLGGYVYRAPRNPCLQGKYIYGDYLQNSMWAATVYPPAGQKASTRLLGVNCTADSAIPCAKDGKGRDRFGNIRFGWGQDQDRELYLLANDGVYRVADMGRCGFKC